jgi:hypothetical protein
MHRRFILLLSCIMVSANVASAATNNGKFAAYSVGAQPCSVVLQAYAGTDRAKALLEVSSWLSGYISGLNRLKEDTYDATSIMDHASLTFLTLRICEKNPKQLYESVTNAMIESFSSIRSREEVGGVTIESGGQIVRLRTSAIKKLQLILVDQGYLKVSRADGIYGKNTSSAITAWQEKNALKKTGNFDTLTVFMLLQSKKNK